MKFILSSALVSVLLSAVLIYGLVSSFNSATLNGSLAESGLYEKLTIALIDQLAGFVGETNAKVLVKARAKVKEDPTAGYLRNMIEKFDNDLFDYLDGKTSNLPFIALPGKVAPDSLWAAVQPLLKAFEIPQKFELPANVASNLETVKQGYGWFKLSPLILAALALVLALLLALFGKDWAHRARLLGKPLLFASIFGLAIFIGLSVLLPKLPSLQIPNIPPQMQFVQEPILAFAAAFLGHINSSLGMWYGGILIAGIVLFVGSKFLPKKESA